MTKLRDKRLFLLDMDGTIYIGDRLFDGVPEFLRHVRAMGGRYLFLTNNSSRGVEGYMEKLRRMGIETTRDDYLTSVDATVRYLRETLPGKTKAPGRLRLRQHVLGRVPQERGAGRQGGHSLRSRRLRL